MYKSNRKKSLGVLSRETTCVQRVNAQNHASIHAVASVIKPVSLVDRLADCKQSLGAFLAEHKLCLSLA